MLEPFDVAEAEESLYRVMLGRPDSTIADLAEVTGRDSSRLRRQLRTLEARGLVTATPTRPVRYRPAPPDLAIEVLALHQHQRIDRARLDAAELAAVWHAAHRDREPPIQIIEGAEANVQCFVQTQLATREEVLTFDKPPYVLAGIARQAEVQRELMARGVRYRTIYDRQSLAEPEQVALARELARLGEQARVLDNVPLKLLITDRAHALVPFQLTDERQTLVLRRSPLLDSLVTLFELLWERATPLWSAGRDGGVTDDDAQLLGFAAAGYTDETIARRIGVNKRTVERRMRRIMDELGARTRFQAGLQAAHKGILGAPPGESATTAASGRPAPAPALFRQVPPMDHQP
ncbi:transcriptional regulator [Longispora fulva]|uniref:Sugar-specific transcriptional regulator TrmB/DNA-binding CsgD family transcriptional regulator n=1 Tax=Longispora fulva TaxID=619741 RepID=A0A8J7GAW3_9ACTN|nr:helix-turn-helix transcriptional regulator [Longispora fulva]MBG6135009.1 sugar-specific transcriptional regulator TrmB/DNA-binding CsgD family transcriptional regulator [Longispora fulva]GIG56757.1 transcriptional regulator [Longispora fulva]